MTDEYDLQSVETARASLAHARRRRETVESAARTAILGSGFEFLSGIDGGAIDRLITVTLNAALRAACDFASAEREAKPGYPGATPEEQWDFMRREALGIQIALMGRPSPVAMLKAGDVCVWVNLDTMERERAA